MVVVVDVGAVGPGMSPHTWCPAQMLLHPRWTNPPSSAPFQSNLAPVGPRSYCYFFVVGIVVGVKRMVAVDKVGRNGLR